MQPFGGYSVKLKSKSNRCISRYLFNLGYLSNIVDIYH